MARSYDTVPSSTSPYALKTARSFAEVVSQASPRTNSFLSAVSSPVDAASAEAALAVAAANERFALSLTLPPSDARLHVVGLPCGRSDGTGPCEAASFHGPHLGHARTHVDHFRR